MKQRKSKKERMLDEFVKQLCEEANMKGDELAKHIIIYKAFYSEVKPMLKKMPYNDQCRLIQKFLLFVVQFETVCIRAYKPISGSQSTARDIISMYSSRFMDSTKKINERHN